MSASEVNDESQEATERGEQRSALEVGDVKKDWKKDWKPLKPNLTLMSITDDPNLTFLKLILSFMEKNGGTIEMRNYTWL